MEPEAHVTKVPSCPMKGCMYNSTTGCFLNGYEISDAFIIRYGQLQNGVICTVRQQINQVKAENMLNRR